MYYLLYSLYPFHFNFQKECLIVTALFNNNTDSNIPLQICPRSNDWCFCPHLFYSSRFQMESLEKTSWLLNKTWVRTLWYSNLWSIAFSHEFITIPLLLWYNFLASPSIMFIKRSKIVFKRTVDSGTSTLTTDSCCCFFPPKNFGRQKIHKTVLKVESCKVIWSRTFDVPLYRLWLI